MVNAFIRPNNSITPSSMPIRSYDPAPADRAIAADLDRPRAADPTPKTRHAQPNPSNLPSLLESPPHAISILRLNPPRATWPDSPLDALAVAAGRNRASTRTTETHRESACSHGGSQAAAAASAAKADLRRRPPAEARPAMVKPTHLHSSSLLSVSGPDFIFLLFLQMRTIRLGFLAPAAGATTRF
jgi:hypothetical protein